MALKKLRGGPTIQVNDQIIRWREKLRKEGKTIGKRTASRKDKERKQKYTDDLENAALAAKGKFNPFK